MKKILILLLIVSSFKLVAQHQDLQQIWYVQSLTVNGVKAEIPNDPIELPYIYIQFFNTPSGLLGSGNPGNFNPNTNCNIGGFNGHANYIGTNIFEFLDFTAGQNVANCSTEIVDFMNLYIGFYEAYVAEQFIYSITTEIDNSKTLLVTNNNGDTVTYTNVFFNSAPQELSSNTWYLHNLIIDSVDNIPPNNTELPEITLRFTVNKSLFIYACDYIVSAHFFDYTLSQFYLYETVAGLIACGVPLNNNYHNLYSNFYLNSLPGPFSYEHTIDGDTETLIITNSLGNQAIYKNATLSIQDYDKASFSIFPNPVIDKLTIKELGIGEVEHIWVYNILGKEIISTKQKTVDLQELDAGVYLVKVKLKNRKTVTRKIIKN